ncbi:MAG: hypothetical protein SGI99_16395 [Pseudomonadota bacterium]|nr:hypothetical protein [Pseudomonadota bacterium]
MIGTRPLAVLSLLTLSSLCAAADIRVTRTDDPLPNGCTALDCSLREAVLAANIKPDVDRILLDRKTYNLTRTDSTPATYEADSGPLWFTHSANIVGAGRDLTRVRWNVLYKFYNPVIKVNWDAPVAVALKLSQLTLSNGRGDWGGCVDMQRGGSPMHSLDLNQVVVEACSAVAGGAMKLDRTDLVLTDSILRNNSASASGGALAFYGAVFTTSVVQSSGSEIASNHAALDGGAISIWSNPVDLRYTGVAWSDDGTSTISGNVADRNGGAIAVSSASKLVLTLSSSAAAEALFELADNQAGISGGAIWMGSGTSSVSGWISVIEGVRMLRNRAAEGGAVTTQSGPLQLRDSVLADNVASSGNGGAIAIYGSASFAVELERLGLNGNSALAGAGGAIHADCRPFVASNLSFANNQALGSRGQAIDVLGSVTLRHVSMSANAGVGFSTAALRKGYSTLCAGATLRYANSLINDRCSSTVGGQLISEGGNQLGVNAALCPSLPTMDQRQSNLGAFALNLAAFGGAFDVLGWPSDQIARPQRNFGLNAYCTAADVRGFARTDGRCDSGAFEQLEN